MNNLTDLEICKRVAEIDGHDWHNHYTMGGSIIIKKYNVHSAPDVFFKQFNPLTDDALCFQLMVKYEVERVCEPYDFIGWHYHCLNSNKIEKITERTHFGDGEYTKDLTPNKAICLAIINAHCGENNG